jgi:hypothetical protein
MNIKDLNSQFEKERAFYDLFNEEKYGKYYFILIYSITTFRFIDQWENEILPYLESLKNKTGKINDWNSFPWKGEICFRHDYIMILDESIHQVGRKFPGIIDDKECQILNDEYEWLLDTEFIRMNYTEFVIISIDDFIEKCIRWIGVIKTL